MRISATFFWGRVAQALSHAFYRHPLLLRGVFLFVLMAPALSPALARDHIVAPVGATLPSGTATGTAQSPWPSLNAAFRSRQVRGGDRIILQPGDHGRLRLFNQRFDRPVMIVAQTPGTARLSEVFFNDVQNMELRDLAIWPDRVTESGKRRGFLVRMGSGTRDIVLHGFDVRNRADAPETYMTRSLEDWLGPWAAHGVRLEGQRITLRDSRLTGLDFAVSVHGDDNQVLNSYILGFSGDGIRGLGNNGIYSGNRVENCFKINENHDDGFQSWSRIKNADGVQAVHNLRIDGNTIIEWTGPEDHPLKCSLQGIGLFDGFFVDTKIVNNLVVVSHYHGLSVYGSINGVIAHNTVVQRGARPGQHPWVLLSDHKSAGPSKGNQVRNNLAMKYRNTSSDRVGFSMRNNAVIKHPGRLFEAPLDEDYRLLEAAPFRNAVRDPVPGLETDLTGAPRVQGTLADYGAYERP